MSKARDLSKEKWELTSSLTFSSTWK